MVGEGVCVVVTTVPQFARICLATGAEGPLGLAHFGDARIRGKARALAEFVGGCGCGRPYCALQPKRGRKRRACSCR